MKIKMKVLLSCSDKEEFIIECEKVINEVKSIMTHAQMLMSDSDDMAQTRIAMLSGRIDILESLGLVTVSGADELRSIVDDAEIERKCKASFVSPNSKRKWNEK